MIFRGIHMRPLILTAAFLAFACLSFSAPSRAQFPPVGGGGTCTGMINEEGYQGQQTAVNNGLYLCSGGTWVEQPLILGNTAAACSATWQGGIRYTGAAIEYCNGTAWTALASGSGATTIDDLTDAIAGATNLRLVFLETPTNPTLEIFDIHVPIALSFSVILVTLTLSIIFSVLIPKKRKAEDLL